MAAVICIFSTNTNAQHLVFLYGHGIYDMPMNNNFKSGYTAGAGVEGGAGIGWKKTFLVGTVGYSNFFHKTTDGGSTSDLHYIPIKAGLRQYLFLKNFYIHGDLGLGNIKDKTTSDTRFSGDIGAGIKLIGFEAQIDYDGFSRKSPEPSGYASWISLKAGFAIGL